MIGLRRHEITRFIVNPATGAKELTPEYRAAVTKAFLREARRMNRALYIRLLYLHLHKFILEVRQTTLAFRRNVEGQRQQGLPRRKQT